MKTCSKCLVKKPLDAFYKRLQSKDGRRGQCMACMDAYCKDKAEIFRSSEPEENKSEKTCTGCNISKPVSDFTKWRASKDGYKAHCRQCASAKRKKNYDANREVHNQRTRAYYAANKELFKRHKAAYMAANQEAIREYNSKWMANNLSRIGAKNARRYAEKLQATPKWADPKKIQQFYDEARRLTLETGIQHEVDHVVPLKGPIAKSGPFKGERLVCGLHWEGNMQILTMVDNISKKNYFWPDMPDEHIATRHMNALRRYAATAQEPESNPAIY